jgi:hypothetical protein
MGYGPWAIFFNSSMCRGSEFDGYGILSWEMVPIAVPEG